MKTATTILIGVIISIALFTGCASMGTGHKTAQALQKDQGSSIQCTDNFVDELKY